MPDSSSSPLNVLLFTSSFPYDGNPVYGIFVYDFARSISSKVNVAVLSPRYTKTSAQEQKDGFRIYRWHQCCLPGMKLAGKPGGVLPALKKNPFLWLFLGFFLLSEFFALRKVVKKENINIIHAHWLLPQGLLAAVYKKYFNKDIKIVITCHGSDINKVNRGIMNRLKCFALKNADRVVAVSEDLANKIRAIYDRTPVIVQPMGVDTEAFSPKAARSAVRIGEIYNLKSAPVLFVGSLIELKGIRYLVTAWQEVKKHHPEAELLVVGYGELLPELKKLSKMLGIEDSIHFAGMVAHERLPEYFAQSALFVLPSFSEGFSLVVSEALSSCTPVIISRISIFEKLFGDKSFVDYCQAGDAASIAQAIIGRLDRGVDRSASARDWVLEHISQGYVAERYCTLYQEIAPPVTRKQ